MHTVCSVMALKCDNQPAPGTRKKFLDRGLTKALWIFSFRKKKFQKKKKKKDQTINGFFVICWSWVSILSIYVFFVDKVACLHVLTVMVILKNHGNCIIKKRSCFVSE